MTTWALAPTFSVVRVGSAWPACNPPAPLAAEHPQSQAPSPVGGWRCCGLQLPWQRWLAALPSTHAACRWPSATWPPLFEGKMDAFDAASAASKQALDAAHRGRTEEVQRAALPHQLRGMHVQDPCVSWQVSQQHREWTQRFEDKHAQLQQLQSQQAADQQAAREQLSRVSAELDASRAAAQLRGAPALVCLHH